MIEKIGVIKSAKFGLGGYQDVQIVFEFVIGGDGWGTTCTHECGWGHVSKEDLCKPGNNYKWTHEGRVKQIGEKAYDVIELMQKSKVNNLKDLVGKPVKVFFESEFGRNHGFKILEEAIL